MVKVQINHATKHLPRFRTFLQRRAFGGRRQDDLIALILGAIVALPGAVIL
jgi:hypothetical protein